MSRLDSHVAAVQRKLALATFVEWLAVTGFVLAVLALLTILFQRFTAIGLPKNSLLVGLGLSVLAALVMALLNLPSRQSAAVAIDEKLSLKEKFSTALSIRNWDDPFAKAAVLDAEQTAGKVHLQGQFPMRLPKMAYWTLLAGVLALAATRIPQMDLLGKKDREVRRQIEERQLAQDKQRIEKIIAKVEALPLALRNNEEIKTAKAHLEELIKHASIPEREKLARREMELAAKIDEALKQQMQESKAYAEAQKAASMFKSNMRPVDGKGPVAEAQRKIVEGKYAEAMEELKKLGENFNEMKPEDKQAAVQQMQQVAQQLAAMAQDQKAMEKLAAQMQQAKIDPQQVQKAQELVQKAAMGDKQAQQQLQQMAQQLQQQMQQQGANQQQQQAMQRAMQQAMQQAAAQNQAGQMAQAAQAMAQAMQQMQAGGQNAGQQMAGAQGQMADALGQLEAMQQDAQAMALAQQALQDAMGQAGNQLGGQGQGQQGGQGEWQPGDINRQGQGMGGPGIGMGGRGPKTPAPYGIKQELSPSAYNAKGEHLASMMVKDRSIRGESKAMLAEIAKVAMAEEGEDVENSLTDRRSQTVKRKYFQVMAEEAAE